MLKFLIGVVLGVLVFYNLQAGPDEDLALKKRGQFLRGHLRVPLDYTNASDPRNASIAVAVYPAGGGKTPKEDILGSLILNPGGPGGSGIQFVQVAAEGLDKKFEGRYNIVGFDPRGTGASWPKLECLDVDVWSRTLAVHGLPGFQSDEVHPHEVGARLALNRLLADTCANSADSALQRFMGTVATARDLQLLHRALGDEKLHYWGFSYGSVLGSTYADLFPDDVGRLAIDGILDARAYYAGALASSLQSIEDELDGFFVECAKSGNACALSALSTNSPALKAAVMDWGHELKQRPVPVARAGEEPYLYTYFSFISQLFGAMYAPSSWPELASNLYAAIAHGDFAGLPAAAGFSPIEQRFTQIYCGDVLANPSVDPSPEEYVQYTEPLAAMSPHFASFFAKDDLLCRAWSLRAPERYEGSFTANTSFPLLIIGNDYDPVTPLASAETMAALFETPVVRRAGYGHCSSSQPSKCVDDIIVNYFLHGEMPGNMYCPVDTPVFGGLVDPTSFSAIIDPAFAALD